MVLIGRIWSLFFISCFYGIFFVGECSSCGPLNETSRFSPLEGVWPVVGNNPSVHYDISLCSPLHYDTSPQKEQCVNSSVCAVSNGTALSLGKFMAAKNDFSLVEFPPFKAFNLFLTGSICGTEGKVSRAVIGFLCGEHLGSPELSLYSECTANFYWRTYAACKTPQKRLEVPCYVINVNGDKIDLTDLIKTTGAYQVQTADSSMEFAINVCSNIKDTTYKNCPANSSACRISNGNAVSVGELKSGLTVTEEGLVLIYESQQYNGCAMKPQTKIVFRCPERLQSRPPRLISKYLCQYEVEWETEFACPERMLVGDVGTCQFTQKDHGVQIDLSPLRKTTGQYKVSAEINGTAIDFYFNVCGGLNNMTCGGASWRSMAVCAQNPKNISASQILGRTKEAELKYADGQILLTYGKGKCDGGGINQATIISFICDNNEDDKPKYVTAEECIHYFEWRTPHACVKGPLETTCVVEKGDRTIDLLRLHIKTGRAWEIIDATESTTKNLYFMNVCGGVSELEHLSTCGEDAAMCMMIDSNGTTVNLGRFGSSPTYDATTDSVVLEYTNGAPCDGNSNWSSSIRFICQPGHLNGPVLINVNKDKCLYEVEWRTAVVCPLGVITGSNCKIYDPSLGLGVDLTPLQSTVYEVETNELKFSLGVCESIHDSCSVEGAKQNVSACLFHKNNGTSLAIGYATDNLLYVNGYINLTYEASISATSDQKSRVSIIFLCDEKAGNGNPIFVKTFNYTYEFHWYTDLVCEQATSTSCVIHDPASHNMYDLSSLSRFDKNWETTFKDGGVLKRLHINVCRRLVPGTNCDHKAGACITEGDGTMGTSSISNAGQPFENPQVNAEHYLQLNYSNGSPCVAYGVNTTQSTIIHFLCAENPALEQGPRFLGRAGNCQLIFLWTTAAACPTGDIIVKDSCQLTDPATGFSFDLVSLRRDKSPYTVSSKSRFFQLNICGPVKGGCFNGSSQDSIADTGICEAAQNGTLKSNLGSSKSFTLKYSKENDLTLIYGSPNKDSPSAVIRFLCVNGTSDPNPRFVEEDHDHIFFEMKTSLACETEYFQCRFTDPKGIEYDLTPLSSNLGSNYVVGDSRPNHSGVRYHLNFCRPLHRVSLYKCPGGATAACQIDIHDASSIGLSLGTQYHPPTVSDDGSVSIRYTNGTECSYGEYKRSARINLFCSRIEGVMVFIGETPECEYIFSMNTPFACPLQTSLGSNCTVTDPMYGYQFDLRPLKNVLGNVTAGPYNYFISVCNSLQNNVPDGCKNFGVCQTKPSEPGFSKTLGLPSANLIYNKGLIMVTYENGAGNCHGKYNRSSVVTFTCDHKATESVGPAFVTEAEDCTYVFEWPTKHACPPTRSVECSVEDEEGNIYDLSKLSLSSDNYFVNSGSPTQTFVLNVCKSVVHTPDSICPYSSAACLMDQTNPDISQRAVNIGEANLVPSFENGKIRLKYSTGDACKTANATSARFFETIIDFTCDKHSVGGGELEYIGKDDCTFYFDWATAYACPGKDVQSAGNCAVEDPITGYMYNLTSLRHNTSYSIQYDTHVFHLNICDKVRGSVCENETGLCQEELNGAKRHWDAGKPNGNLELRGNVLFLNYSDGEPCHGGRYKRNTIIIFRCGTDEESTAHPTFMYESLDCSYYFTWTNKLACQFEVHCAVKNGTEHYDLSPLSTAGYYIARSTLYNDDSMYFINICGPLFNMRGIPCPPSASICKVGPHNDTGEDLGSIAHPPFIDFEGHATAIYNNGSECSTNRLEQNRARILFLCDRTQLLGEPVLIEITTEFCFYLFEWRTSLVCPTETKNSSQIIPCMYKDVGKGIYFDLSSLRRPESYYEIKDNSTDGSYLLNVCDTVNSAKLDKCANATVCHRDGDVYNYGIADSQRFTYDGKRLRLFIDHGDDCPSGEDGRGSSEIFFVCNPNAGAGKPKLYKKLTCLVVFVWETNIVCRNLQHQCMFDVDGKVYDLHLLSSMSHNWNLTDEKNNTYYLNLCRGIMQDNETAGCPPSAAVCMKDKNGSHMPLGMTYTVSASNTQGSTDLILTYNSQSNQACMDLKLAHEYNATTRIFMTCGKTRGYPKLLAGPDDHCFYDFTWKTSLVCPEKTQEVLLEENGILYDKRLQYGMDLGTILNKTFIVPGNTGTDRYLYRINLSGNFPTGMDGYETCAMSAVCQIKENTTFRRDIGSFDTRKFYLRGTELHLTLYSLEKACGRQPTRNVTTVIIMQCSTSAGAGIPEFLYETGGCDYVFNWETSAVCPNFNYSHVVNNTADTSQPSGTEKHAASSSHRTSAVIGFLILACMACLVIFVLSKAERRSAVASKFRVCFSRVTMPRFRYKRGDMLTELQSDF